MKRIRQGWNTLRRSRRSGVSLIVALCAVAVLIGLSLSIVYSSSMLLSRANRKIGRERCYQLAQSFAQVLDSELQEYKTIKPELDTNFAPEGCFYREVNNILAEDTGLGIYDPDRSDETTACYNAGSTEDNYGRITILLRDVTDAQDPITGDTFAYDARDEGTEKAEQTTFNRHQVWVGVKAEKGADSYMYTTEYRRKDSFQPIYTWKGEDGVSGQFPVYWVNGRFCRSANGEEPVEPKDIGEGKDARTEELNSAELIADDLLETVRSKVETATDYIKCYDSGTDVTNKTGSSEGSAIEFGYETEQGYNAVELLTADGCGPTKIVIADKDSGEQPRVEKGYLVERYYKDGYSQDADGNPIARAMTKTYAEGFYMGLRAGLHFKIDEAKHTVTATVTIYRDKDLIDKIYSDSLIIDLRYDIPVKTEVTATKKPA